MILALGLAKSESQETRRDLQSCVSILENMEQVGFCRSVLQELPTRLAQPGVKSEPKEMDMEVSLMQGAGDILQPNLDFFGGLFPNIENA